MRIIKLIILVCISSFIISSCKKDATKANAEVISFNSEKCGCCWGWTIKKGRKEFRTDNSKVGEKVGYNIDQPVSVYVELGKKDDRCSKYYELIRIEKID